MNKNIEDILKEALENHDAGYVSGAWESMSARLDGTAPTPFYKKWWAAAAFGTVLVGTAAFFMLNETPAQETKTVQAKNSPKENTSTAGKNSIFDTKTAQTNTPTDKQTYFLPPIVNGKSSGSGSASCSGLSGSVNGNSIGEPAGQPGNPVIDLIGAKPNPAASAKYANLDLPKTVCLNEEVSISNPNEDKSIFVIDPSGKKVELAAKKNLSFDAKTAGTITVQSGDHADYITVNQNKTDLYIDVDPSLLYENGIPTLKFKVTGNANNLSWNSNIKDSETKGDTYIVHPYTETSVEVKVANTNEAGCKVEEKQVVTLDERYNLLAPTAFDPMSSDPRNKTFMPYALTQRSVMFEMTIIDPRTGAKIYSTSDALEGWTGIDQRTNEMVKGGSVWVWKVWIKNPNTGEPKEYTGSITKL